MLFTGLRKSQEICGCTVRNIQQKNWLDSKHFFIGIYIVQNKIKMLSGQGICLSQVSILEWKGPLEVIWSQLQSGQCQTGSDPLPEHSQAVLVDKQVFFLQIVFSLLLNST